MTKEQKQDVLISIQVAQKHLQQIKVGQDECAKTVSERRQVADWKLCHLLEDLLPALPKDLQVAVQECYRVRQQIWSSEYSDAFYDQLRQKEARSESLATANEL